MRRGRSFRARLWRGVALFAPCAVLPGLACGGASGGAQRIVLITLDTLRYDSFDGDGSAAPSMPRTRAWARQALLFRRHYASTSTTQPTHASLLTGLHPWRHGVPRNGAVLTPELDTVPERLARAGYATAAVVASFPLHHLFGFAQGFDRYDDDFRERDLQVWEGLPVPGRRFYSRADAVTARAIAALDGLRGPRQFLWVHYFDPHDPYDDAAAHPLTLRDLLADLARAPQESPERLRQARAAYDRDVHFMDGALGELLERLEADAERIETHVIAVSDHGESFGESGSLGHGKRLTPEQVRVPLLIRSPRVAPGVNDVPVGSVDVAATLLALAGLADPTLPGRDLTRQLAPGEVLGMRRTFAEPYADWRTDGRVHVVAGALFYAVTGDRVVRGNGGGIAAGDGPLEAGQAADLQRRFATFERELGQRGLVEAVDSEAREALEALGYVR